jgi:hypothetical protein
MSVLSYNCGRVRVGALVGGPRDGGSIGLGLTNVMSMIHCHSRRFLFRRDLQAVAPLDFEQATVRTLAGNILA